MLKAYLLTFVSNQAQIAYPHYAHISSLHHQVTRGRDIIVAESAQLHLVWYYDRIFVKPIPAYLLSSAWWSWIERSDRDVFMAACGFLRSYSCLIQYETDFRRAQKELFLIPEKDDKGPITFEQFAKFIAVFAKCEDDSVSLRYHYGELRLTRLNWLSRLFLRKLTFHHIHAQWSDFLGRALAPTITLFVILSTILSAMQVALAVQAIDEGPESWMPFMKVSRWFSIVVILIVAVLIASVTGVIIFMAVHDQLFARKVIRQKKQPAARGKTLHSGVV